MYQINYKPNVASVLAALADSIRISGDQVDQFLDTRINGSSSHGFWEMFGIRKIIPNIFQDQLENPVQWQIEKDMHDTIRTLINGCSIIQFADWSTTDNASGVWYRLFSDVIKPLNRRDLEFIFQPGDTTKRLVFEVDEMLDIMGDYSSYGRVTLILDENEADSLWKRLNGGSSDATDSGSRQQETKEKYQFLFNTMSIDVLLILYSDHVVLFSRDGQFDFAGRSLNNTGMPRLERDCFIAGYQLGLLLHLETLHCIMLGLAVSGVCMKNISKPDAKALLTYIHDWIEGLNATIY